VPTAGQQEGRLGRLSVVSIVSLVVISRSLRTSARSPAPWIRLRRAPGVVKRSRWGHGSRRRCPRHSTLPTRKWRPTRESRSIPRVMTFASSRGVAEAVAVGQPQAVEDFGLDQSEVVATGGVVGGRG